MTRAAGAAGRTDLNRYWKTLWGSRPDLREAFPDFEGADADAFARWRRDHLREEAEAAGRAPGAQPPAPPRPGVNLIGYLSSERGLGESARQVRAALEAGGVPAVPIDIPPDEGSLRAALGALGAESHPYELNLACVNADMMPAVVAAAGPQLFAGRRTAGLWFWEVSSFPDFWTRSFDALDEVWVATEHVAGALRPIAPVPVRVLRLPIVPAPAAAMSRAELGMPEGFCFLFVFDYRSVFRRKNPLAAVRAFSRAFAPGEGPSLVIKSVAGEDFPADREALKAAAAERPDVHLAEGTVSPAVKNALISACDCYLSLHRAEGLGLTMAEAMYFERPVIATGYSGNLDFMSEENSFLVRHEMVPVGAGAAPYPADGEWAEPDSSHAAELMRRVVEEPRAAVARARRGAADIRRTHSHAAAAEILRERLGL
jgi:glycosyltransferase involved in cell wall biosynthesis